MPYELFLALRYLRYHRGRTFLSIITLISVAGVAVGTAALVIALALMTGFVDDVRERIFAGSAHLTLMSTRERTFGDAATLMQRAESVPGVSMTGPVLYSPAMIVPEGVDSPEYAEILGIDPQRHGQVVESPGPFQKLAAPGVTGREGIVLGSELAANLGVTTGDRVRVFVPRVQLTPWSLAPRSRLFEVVETFHSDHFQQNVARAYVAQAAAGRLLQASERVSWVEVRLEDREALASMKRALQQALGPPWVVIDLLEQNEEIVKALKTEKLMLFLAIGLIVVVAALNIVSTLILMVTDKLKEIGTLSAMGARPESIAVVFMLQGFIIGVVGTAIGLLLGSSIAYWLDRYRIIELNPDVYYLTHLPFSPRASDLLFVGLSALVISLLATIYPALKAARLRPVEAIRHE